jgi:hypothetical protein
MAWLSMTIFFISLTTKPAKKPVRYVDLEQSSAKLSYIYSFEDLDGYDALYSNVYNRDEIVNDPSHRGFWLLGVSETKDTLRFTMIDKENKLESEELGKILSILYRNNAFIADVQILNELKFIKMKVSKLHKKLRTNSTYKVKTFSKIAKYFDSSFKKDNPEFVYLTFGISDLVLLKRLDKDLLYDMNSKCKYRQMSTNYSDIDEKYILSNMYVVCHKLVIQIAVFYTRGHFLWTTIDSYHKGPEKLFGDKHRAMEK